MGVRIGLLGEVVAHAGGAAVDLGPARQRCVLAALAIDAPRLVPVDRLVERVWGVAAPPRARKTLHSYLSRLRQALPGVEIVSRSGGYALVAPPEKLEVDLRRFRELCARRDAADPEVVRSLTEALALWRGEPLTGLTGEWAEEERDRLDQERLAAEHDLADARLRAGDGGELVAELSARAAAHPLDERVARQYLLALHRAGRTADALTHYRLLRDRLVAELGTDPGAELQDLHRQLLAADPALTSRPASAVPRQLPAAPAPFAGRQDELARLDAAVAAAPMAVVAIAGTGGIGKTWLALHWAHRRLDRFPDGQLFVDLRGFGPEDGAMEPAVALRGFLDALGVPADRVPVDPHAQTALFRSLVADRRMLVLLDNAVDTGQVTPLLPGSGSCTVLVTSRHRLPGLLTGHSAHHLPLEVLARGEAKSLLTGKIGEARAAAEPAAVDELVALCGGLPLALSIVAGQAQTRSGPVLATLAAELREFGLGALADVDPIASLPAVLSWSHRRLSEAQLTAFALLGCAPGADVALTAAAALLGLPLDATAAVLRALEQASLLTRTEHGRYVMHDLVRDHAARTANTLPEEVRTAAVRRVADFYLHTADAAERLLDANAPVVPLDPPVPGACPRPPEDLPSALSWLGTEHANLLAAQALAAAHGWHRQVWQFAWALATYHLQTGLGRAAITTWQAALTAAEHLPDPTFRIRAQRLLGYACSQAERHEEAVDHLHHALDLAEHHRDATEQAHTHRLLTRLWGYRGDFAKALGHAEQALTHFSALGKPVWEAEALNAAGWCAAVTGDLETARARCQDALVLFRRHDVADGEAASLDSLGYIEHGTGDHRRAIGHYERALALFRELGRPHSEADTLQNLGHPHAELGEVGQARAVWQRALELYREQERTTEAERVRQQLAGLP